jgi:hypothetical protein
MIGNCRLCGNRDSLKLSHIVPNFIGKWTKETSATGFIRHYENINKRQQDFAKEYLLCGSCEELFSQWEREFSSRIFNPLIDRGDATVEYGEWLAKFCASLSWRTLTYIREKNEDTENTWEIESLDRARIKLSEFLLGKTDKVDEFEQHLFPLGGIISTTSRGLPNNINRYLMRTVHLDLLSTSKEIFIYTKFPMFILLGFVKVRSPEKMRSSKIAMKRGVISPRKYVWPTGLMEYIADKANSISNKYTEMSDKQQRAIDDYVKNNPERVANSETFKAFMHDYELFGKDAFR